MLLNTINVTREWFSHRVQEEKLTKVVGKITTMVYEQNIKEEKNSFFYSSVLIAQFFTAYTVNLYIDIIRQETK